MTTLHDINHDSGGVPTTHWDNENDASGGLSVGVAGGLNSTAQGLIFDMTVDDEMEASSSFTPPGTNELAFRIYIDPNGNEQIGSQELIRTGVMETATGYANGSLFFVQVGNDELSTDIDVSVFVGNDGGAFDGVGGAVISDAEHYIDVEIIRETGDDTGDGIIRWYLDGVFQASKTDAQIYNVFANADTIYVNNAENDIGGNGIDDFYIDEIFVTDVTGASIDGVYSLAVATDAEQATDVLYITLWRDGELYLQEWDGDSMTSTAEIPLGSASIGQVQVRTNVAYPYCGSDSNMWVFGRMTAPAWLTGTAHLIETDGGGASGSWFRPSGLESWNDSDVLQSLHVTPPLSEAGDRTFTGVRWQSDTIPELWRGLNQMAFQIAIPFPTGTGVNYQGMDVSLIDEVAVGNTNIGEGTQRILSIFEPFSEWGDITYDYPSGTVDVLRFF